MVTLPAEDSMYWAFKVRPSALVHVRTGSPAKTSRGKKQNKKLSLVPKIAHVFHQVYDPSRDHFLGSLSRARGKKGKILTLARELGLEFFYPSSGVHKAFFTSESWV